MAKKKDIKKILAWIIIIGGVISLLFPSQFFSMFTTEQGVFSGTNIPIIIDVLLIGGAIWYIFKNK